MSELERLAASVLCVGFDGAFAEHAPLRELAELGPGGVVLFARNPGDLVETRASTPSARRSKGKPARDRSWPSTRKVAASHGCGAARTTFRR